MSKTNTYNIVFVKTSTYFGKAIFNNNKVTIIDYKTQKQINVSLATFSQIMHKCKMVLVDSDDDKAIHDYKGTFFERQEKRKRFLMKLYNSIMI